MEVDTFKYDNVLIEDMNKQISLTMPLKLLEKVQKEAKKTGHRTSQEYILQLVRDSLLKEELNQIHAGLVAGKGLHFKNEKEFSDYLDKRGSRIK